MTIHTISNAGPLIVLGKLNRLELLAELYETVAIPQTVYDEVVTQGLRHGATDATVIRLFWNQKQWPIVALNSEIRRQYQAHLQLDRGEQDVLALATSVHAKLVLLDDEAARSEARRLGFTVRGSVGIVAQSYQHGILNLPQTELLLQEIATRSDIWISERLCQQVIQSLKQVRP
jgi:predicted nucleic acid-binding protein